MSEFNEPSTLSKKDQRELGFRLNPLTWLAFGLGTGLVPKAPGTFGTLLAIPLYVLLQELILWQYLLVVMLTFIAGIGICGYAAKQMGVHDHPSIVWDEVVGYLVTMTASPPGWQWVITGFILFRIFDIWKPWPVNVADRHVKGGLGIMLDDLIAGIFALVVLQVLVLIVSW